MSARCCIQQATCGHRDRKGEPLYAARRTLHTMRQKRRQVQVPHDRTPVLRE